MIRGSGVVRWALLLLWLGMPECRGDLDVPVSEPMSLLSDNIAPGKATKTFPEGTRVVRTGASYAWVSEGEFATDPETLLTGSRPDGTSKCLFDGHGGGWVQTQSFSKWSGGRWATIRIDLKDAFLIGALDVWALRQKQRDTESAELLLSEDGVKFVSYGLAANTTADRETNAFIKLACTLDKPVKARYAEVRIKRAQGGFQQQIGEIAVWGWNPGEGAPAYREAGDMPPVRFTVRPVQEGVALVDWRDYFKTARNVKRWKIYGSENAFADPRAPGVKLLKAVPGDASSSPVYPLVPGTVTWIGVTEETAEGEGADVLAVACKTPLPFACSAFGDMLAINHFWGGGAARQKRPNAQVWEDAALEMLGQSPFRQTRWWVMDTAVINRFYARGIGVLTYPNADNIKRGNAMGIYGFSAGNEPELSGKPLEVYLAFLTHVFAEAKALSPMNVIAAPTVCTDDLSLEWLERFYAAGGKDYFDVLNIHTYVKVSGGHKVPDGYPLGAPEALIDDLRRVRGITDKYGDSAKPMISTEFGYSDCKAGNPSGEMDPEKKARYLVRGLILHYVLGFRKVYLYSFWDEGDDPYYTEHNFGIVDYHLQWKPAFRAIKAMADLLGDCVLSGLVEGSGDGIFGYVFSKPDGQGVVSVVWDGRGEFLGQFKTRDHSVTVVDLFGMSRLVDVGEKGSFKVPFGRSPVYMVSRDPVVLAGVEKREEPSGSSTAIQAGVARDIVFAGGNGGVASTVLSLSNVSTEDIVVNVSVPETGKKSQTVMVGRKSKVDVPLDLSGGKTNKVLSSVRVRLAYDGPAGSFSEESPVYVRRLTLPAGGGATTAACEFEGRQEPLMVMANERMEVVFDVARGNRMVEMLLAGGGNQLRMDYAKIGSLPGFAFEYGLWRRLNGELRDSPFKIVKAQGGVLEVEATTTGGLRLNETWTLAPDRAYLRLDVKIRNMAATPNALLYVMHPEYCVGGTGDTGVDILEFPVGGSILKLPYWTGLGERKIETLGANWWGCGDSTSGTALKQSFTGTWAQPGVWFGTDCYSVQMENAPATLEPDAVWEGWMDWSFTPRK